MSTKIGGIVALLCGVAYLCCADEKTDELRPLDLLKSSDSTQRQRAVEVLRRQRTEAVQQLISIVNGEYSDQERLDAVRLLGDYRDPEAVSTLVKNLELEDKIGGFRTGIVVAGIAERRIPVRVALRKIGIPAIPALVEKMSGTDDMRIIRICVSICLSIDGRECAQLRLKKAVAAEQNPQKKLRLENASALTETLDLPWW